MNAIAMLTGVSLSFCVKDICRGVVKIEQVVQIIASTCIATDAEFEQVLADYQRTYWRQFPEQAAAVARTLWAAGKIDQPRLRDEERLHPGWNERFEGTAAPTGNWFVGAEVPPPARPRFECDYA